MARLLTWYFYKRKVIGTIDHINTNMKKLLTVLLLPIVLLISFFAYSASYDGLDKNHNVKSSKVTLPTGYFSTQRLGKTGVIGKRDNWALDGGGILIWTHNVTKAKWDAANKICESLIALGYPRGSWRLPTQGELSAMQKAEGLNGSNGVGLMRLNRWVLTGTWTSTAYPSGHYAVEMRDGGVLWGHDELPYHMGCVH
jgi:hypothetical protein